MAIEVIINGTPVPAADVMRDWEITRTANGRALFKVDILSEDGSFRPALDDELYVEEDGTTEFGGEISRALERGIGGSGPGLAIINETECHDFNDRFNRRFVTATLAAGSTVKQAAQAILPFLPGVTLDVAQVDGPAMPEFVWNDVLAGDCTKQVCEAAGGWIGEIDEDEVFRIFEPGTIAAPFNITLENQRALGDITVEPTREGYANHVIVRNATFRKTASAPGYNPATNAREMLVIVPDETPEDTVQATAVTLLARAQVQLKRVTYSTDQDGVRPGMTQVITYSPRNLNNTFLITDVVTRELGGGNKMHDVSAIEGLVYQTGWRETWRQVLGGNGNTLVVSSGGSTSIRYAVPLGGTGVDAVTPSDGVDGWVPASGGDPVHGTSPFQAQLNTLTRGGQAATVTGRVRAEDAGVGVKARLFDVTDGVACPGESALVVDTAWQTVTFGTTLTPGSHFYEVQLWSDTAGAWVRGAGFIVE